MEKDIGELEDEYEERILMEFTKVINDFQTKNNMENVSLIRLMLYVENKLLDELDLDVNYFFLVERFLLERFLLERFLEDFRLVVFRLDDLFL